MYEKIGRGITRIIRKDRTCDAESFFPEIIKHLSEATKLEKSKIGEEYDIKTYLESADFKLFLVTAVSVNLIGKTEEANAKKIEVLEKRVEALEKFSVPIDFRDESQLDKIIDSSPALKEMAKDKKLSLPSKRLLVKNRDKLERLFKEGKLEVNVRKYAGILEIKDQNLAEDFYK